MPARIDPFVDVLLREHSLTRAAREIDVTQPALSKTLAYLRRYFDDPLFADTDGRLSASSPAIDAGLNAFVPPDVVTDLDGNPRIVDGTNDGMAIVDMGAFEFQALPQVCVGDLDGDGVVGPLDLLLLAAHWGVCPAPGMPEPGANGCAADLNGDGRVDILDILIMFANWGCTD